MMTAGPVWADNLVEVHRTRRAATASVYVLARCSRLSLCLSIGLAVQ